GVAHGRGQVVVLRDAHELDLRVARLHGTQVVVADGPAHFLDAKIEDDPHARSRRLRSTDGVRYGRMHVDVEAPVTSCRSTASETGRGSGRRDGLPGGGASA